MRYWSVLVICGLLLSSCSDMNKLLKSNDYNLKAKKANQYYEAKKYEKAQILFEDIMPVVKGSAEYEDLYYKWTYCHYYQKDYLNAENLFKGFVENFPNSPKAEECEYMRAYCFYKRSPKAELDQQSTMKAIGLMQAFINTHSKSPRVKEASDIIDNLYQKLEVKEAKSAELYYNLGYYLASATAFGQLMYNFPDSQKGDTYKLMIVKSHYKYADNSVFEKQEARFETVLNECADFTDLFPDSKLNQEIAHYKQLATNKIKNIKNEQTKAAAER